MNKLLPIFLDLSPQELANFTATDRQHMAELADDDSFNSFITNTFGFKVAGDLRQRLLKESRNHKVIDLK